MCAFWLLSKTFSILRTIQWDITINVHRSSCTVRFVPAKFERNLRFPNRLKKKYSGTKFHKKKSVQWEPSCSMQTDRQTRRIKIVAFRDFANASKIRGWWCCDSHATLCGNQSTCGGRRGGHSMGETPPHRNLLSFPFFGRKARYNCAWIFESLPKNCVVTFIHTVTTLCRTS